MKVNDDHIKRILVVRNDRFGEFLLNIPAFRALRQTFRNASIVAVVSPYVKELVEDSPYIDEIIVDDFSKKLKAFGLMRLANQLRKQKFDMAIMFNPSKIFNIIAFLAAIPVRVGYDRKGAVLLTHRLKDLKHEGLKPEVEYNLELVNLVGANADNKNISLPIREQDSKFVENLLMSKINARDKLIAIHPWSSNKDKQWPLKNYVHLINLLTEQNNLKIIIVGGKENQDSISEFHFNRKEAVLDLTASLSLRQCSALFTKCTCMVSADSGPVHLAAASNLRTIVLFRASPPAVSFKRWGPWGEGHLVIEKEKLGDITVQEVFDKIKEIL